VQKHTNVNQLVRTDDMNAVIIMHKCSIRQSTDRFCCRGGARKRWEETAQCCTNMWSKSHQQQEYLARRVASSVITGGKFLENYLFQSFRKFVKELFSLCTF